MTAAGFVSACSAPLCTAGDLPKRSHPRGRPAGCIGYREGAQGPATFAPVSGRRRGARTVTTTSGWRTARTASASATARLLIVECPNAARRFGARSTTLAGPARSRPHPGSQPGVTPRTARESCARPLRSDIDAPWFAAPNGGPRTPLNLDRTVASRVPLVKSRVKQRRGPCCSRAPPRLDEALVSERQGFWTAAG